MEAKLRNKNAIITGASRGVGAAIAKKLARDGAHAVVNFSKSADGTASITGQNIRANGGMI